MRTRAQTAAAVATPRSKDLPDDPDEFFKSLLASPAQRPELPADAIVVDDVPEEKAPPPPPRVATEETKPPSPPLAEKLARMSRETPSRFKSDKRLQDEGGLKPLNTACKPTKPEGPRLTTAFRKRVSLATTTTKDVCATAYKALALDRRILTCGGALGVPRVDSAPTTRPKPFGLSTANPRRATMAPVEQPTSIFRASRRSFGAKRPFTPAPSTKALTKPTMPNMPGLKWHEKAAAAKKEKEEKAARAALRPVNKEHRPLKSDARALKRQQFNDLVKQRRSEREADRAAAKAAVQAALDAQLKRSRRASIAQGGLSFVARPVIYR